MNPLIIQYLIVRFWYIFDRVLAVYATILLIQILGGYLS